MTTLTPEGGTAPLIEDTVSHADRCKLDRMLATDPDEMPFAGPRDRANGNWLTCRDGFQLSVIAGMGARARRPPGADLNTEVEVCFPGDRPEPWNAWRPYTENKTHRAGTVYNFVPVDMVRSILALHGGCACRPFGDA